MTREEADFIGGMNMCDEISNEAYKKIMCHCEEQEQKTGHWIKIKPYPLQMHEYECSECGHETDDNTENYCSNCGAKMKSEVKE